MKRLIVCSDGTWNKPAQEDRDQVAPSNVFKIDQAIAELGADGTKQLSFYDTGVGTRWYDVSVVGCLVWAYSMPCLVFN